MEGKLGEILLVVFIILILFGAKKIPELARSIGQAGREVKKGFNGEENESTTKSSKSSSK